MGTFVLTVSITRVVTVVRYGGILMNCNSGHILQQNFGMQWTTKLTKTYFKSTFYPKINT